MTDIDAVARVIAQAYLKQTTGRAVLWEQLTPDERSLWRLVARAAQETSQAAH